LIADVRGRAEWLGEVGHQWFRAGEPSICRICEICAVWLVSTYVLERPPGWVR
jgi:hypothetical protein